MPQYQVNCFLKSATPVNTWLIRKWDSLLIDMKGVLKVCMDQISHDILLSWNLNRRRLPWWLMSQVPVCRCRRLEFSLWARKMPWRRKGSPLQYSCLGNPKHRGRSLADCSPWGHNDHTQLSDYAAIIWRDTPTLFSSVKAEREEDAAGGQCETSRERLMNFNERG